MDVANQAHSVKHLRSTGQARASGSVPIAIKPMAVTGWATGSYLEAPLAGIPTPLLGPNSHRQAGS